MAAIVMTTAKANSHNPTSTPNSSHSSQVQSLNSERTSLQEEKSRLERSQDVWGRWYLGLAIAAVGVVAALGLASWFVQRLATDKGLKARSVGVRISDIEERIRKIQDADASEKISDARNAAAQANERAQNARLRAEEAAQENIRLKAALEREVVDAKQREEELRQQNLVNEARLGSEMDKRLELEKSLAPRVIGIEKKPFKPSNFEPLKPYAGIKVYISAVPDFEARRAASQIEFVIRQAGWAVAEFLVTDNIPVDQGVGIFSYAGEKDMAFSAKARDALAELLEESGWQKLDASDAPAGEVPGWTLHDPNSLRIAVGLKPLPYFDSPQTKESEKKRKEMIQRMKDAQRRWDERNDPKE